MTPTPDRPSHPTSHPTPPPTAAMPAPPDALDAALQAAWAALPEPDDAGFSLAVMRALPAAPPRYAASRRRARRLRWLQWSVSTLAACAAALLWGQHAPSAAELGAGAVLLALLLFWHSPHRWHS